MTQKDALPVPIEAIIDPELNQNYSPRGVEGCLFVGWFQRPGKKKRYFNPHCALQVVVQKKPREGSPNSPSNKLFFIFLENIVRSESLRIHPIGG